MKFTFTIPLDMASFEAISDPRYPGIQLPGMKSESKDRTEVLCFAAGWHASRCGDPEKVKAFLWIFNGDSPSKPSWHVKESPEGLEVTFERE